MGIDVSGLGDFIRDQRDQAQMSLRQLAKAADVVLYGMGREVRYRSEAVASRFVHMAIADLLYTELARADHDTYMENMQKMRIVIAEKRL